MDTQNRSKSVLITGALSGIGRAAAFAFGRAGARIMLAGRDDARGQAVTSELHGLDVEAAFVRADVRRDEI